MGKITLASMASALLLASSFSLAADVTVNTKQGELKLPNNPKNIVVFDLGVVDSLDKLGVSIKGVPQRNMPHYLAKYKAAQYINVGGLKAPDIAQTQSIKPELIIISRRQMAEYKRLAEIAPTIDLDIDPQDYVNSFKNNMQLLATVFDKQAEVSVAIAELDKQAEAISQQVTQSTQKALIVVHYKGKLIAADNSAYAGLIHGWLGVKLVSLEAIKETKKGERLILSSKEVAGLNPDILYVIDRGEAIGEDKLDPKVLEDINIQQTNAYKTNHIIYLTPDLWYLSGGGLESLKLQMAEVAKAFQ